jgi:hypothetical protein
MDRLTRTQKIGHSRAGLARVDFAFVLGLAAYNLVRLPKLIAEAA